MNCVILALFFLTTTSSAYTVLNSRNFEHQTQVTTGGTTGRWLISFHTSPVSSDELSLFTALEVALADRGIVTGSVNVVTERSLHSRFAKQLEENDNNDENSVTLFFPNDGRVYVIAELPQSTDALATMAEILVSGYRQLPSFPIPPEPSLFDMVMSTAQEAIILPFAMLSSMDMLIGLGLLILVVALHTIAQQRRHGAVINDSSKAREGDMHKLD